MHIEQQVNELVSTYGGDTASIILIVTDGKLQDIEVATTKVYYREGIHKVDFRHQILQSDIKFAQ